jgi:hypothetical protein
MYVCTLVGTIDFLNTPLTFQAHQKYDIDFVLLQVSRQGVVANRICPRQESTQTHSYSGTDWAPAPRNCKLQV